MVLSERYGIPVGKNGHEARVLIYQNAIGHRRARSVHGMKDLTNEELSQIEEWLLSNHSGFKVIVEAAKVKLPSIGDPCEYPILDTDDGPNPFEEPKLLDTAAENVGPGH